MYIKKTKKKTSFNDAEKFFEKILRNYEKQDDEKQSLFNPQPTSMSSEEIKKAPTLEKIKNSLKKRKYRHKHLLFIYDVYCAFKFILEKFHVRKSIHSFVLELLENFKETMDEFMIAQNYCCGTWQIRTSKNVVCCGKKNCIVANDAAYFRYSYWNFCEKCFQKFPSDTIKLTNDVSANKSQFSRYINKKESAEDFIICIRCRRLFHERCVMHVRLSLNPYCCKTCLAENDKIFRVSAKNLPSTECDQFISEHLKNCGVEIPTEVTIRLLSCETKSFKMKSLISKYRQDGDYINYQNCALFAFGMKDNYDIAFFSIYFHLYNNDCSVKANRNAAYISYIDSINLLNITDRTKVYQNILLGLIKYLKVKNYSKIMIWSCPPKKIVDYIFYQKPVNMKIPYKQRLSKWYLNFMRMAKEEGIIVNFVGSNKYSQDEHWENFNNIPYFDCDLWPERLEEAIQEIEKKKEVHNQRDINAEIWKLFKVQTAGFNDQYFIINVNENNDDVASEPFEEIKCCLLSDRSKLVDTFWDLKLEFSDERLAKFSTFWLLYFTYLCRQVCMNCSTKCEVSNYLLCKSCEVDRLNSTSSTSMETVNYVPSMKKKCFEGDSPSVATKNKRILENALKRTAIRMRQEKITKYLTSQSQYKQKTIEKQQRSIVKKQRSGAKPRKNTSADRNYKNLTDEVRKCYVALTRLPLKISFLARSIGRKRRHKPTKKKAKINHPPKLKITNSHSTTNVENIDPNTPESEFKGFAPDEMNQDDRFINLFRFSNLQSSNSNDSESEQMKCDDDDDDENSSNHSNSSEMFISESDTSIPGSDNEWKPSKRLKSNVRRLRGKKYITRNSNSPRLSIYKHNSKHIKV